MNKISQPILKLIFIYISLFATGKTASNLSNVSPRPNVLHFVNDNVQDADNHIDAITYNVWGLPIWMPGHHQSYRFKRIADSLLIREFEIICLQEVFNKKVRNHLIKVLVPHFFTATDYSCNKPIIGTILQKDCHGGLMTLSKYPIIKEEFYAFSKTKKTSFIEKIGAKGFLLTTVLRNGQPINIINTHLYAGSSAQAASHRMNQILEMQGILKRLDVYHSYPTLLFGDLNITHPDLLDKNGVFNCAHAYEYITEEMNFIDTQTKLTDDSYTINSRINSFSAKDNTKQKLDYIMVRLPEAIEQKIWLEDQKIDFYGGSALSDHMAWRAKIMIAPQDSGPLDASGESLTSAI